MDESYSYANTTDLPSHKALLKCYNFTFFQTSIRSFFTYLDKECVKKKKTVENIKKCFENFSFFFGRSCKPFVLKNGLFCWKRCSLSLSLSHTHTHTHFLTLTLYLYLTLPLSPFKVFLSIMKWINLGKSSQEDSDWGQSGSRLNVFLV